MQASSTPLVLSFMGKKNIEDLTFLLLVSNICIIAASLYSPLQLTNEQGFLTLRISSKQNINKMVLPGWGSRRVKHGEQVQK